MKVKICGITNLEDARFCAAAGADFLGFIQYEASPRHVSADEARAIIEWLYGPEPVGVFVNEDPDTVNRTADRAGFAYVQLQGTESPGDCRSIERPVIKAIGVRPGMTADDLARETARYADSVDFLLFDRKTDALHGGTGRSFDWSLAAGAAGGTPFFVAGGLHADNVATAISILQPFGVDVASGVESEPGRKDFERVRAFLDAVGPYRPGDD